MSEFRIDPDSPRQLQIRDGGHWQVCGRYASSEQAAGALAAVLSYQDKPLIVPAIRGNRIAALEAQLRDQAAVMASVQGLCYNALRTYGAQHKQFYLEEILQRISTAEEYARVREEWEPGVEP